MEETPPPASPRWGATGKLVVTLTLVVILGALLVRFKLIIGPVVMAFILAYLLLPVASMMSRRTPLSWGVSVNLIYLIFIIILLSLLTWGGVGLIGQVQNLISAVQNYANQLPSFIDSLSHQIFVIGPFKFDFSTIDWAAIGQQILAYVEPALGQVGNLVGTLAGSAVSVLGWMAFIVVISYFFLLESGGFRTRIIHIDIPGYTEDIRRMRQKLGIIWNAFLRGQIIVFFFKDFGLYFFYEHPGGSLRHWGGTIGRFRQFPAVYWPGHQLDRAWLGHVFPRKLSIWSHSHRLYSYSNYPCASDRPGV